MTKLSLRVAFDDQDLQRTAHRRGRLYFYLFWEAESQFFPARLWGDFGILLLCGWFTEVTRLYSGEREATLCFMDGPYALAVRRREGDIVELTGEGEPFRAVTTLREIKVQLIQAAALVVERLESLNIAGEYKDHLKGGIEKFQATARDDYGSAGAADPAPH